VRILVTCFQDAGLKEICRLFLTHPQIDVDFETEGNRQTPLLVACMCGNYEIMRLLTLANAEVNKPNCLNHTPLAVTLFRLMEDPTSF
jgi:ankyrin repeat protein